MKRNLWVMTAIFALFVTATARAQTIGLRANVPFNFTVNGSMIPSGEYSFESTQVQGQVLWTIRDSVTLRPQTNFMSIRKVSEDSNPGTKLVFHRYGDRYFLTEIWIAGHGIGSQLLESPREKELAKELAMKTSMRTVVLSAERR